MKTALRWIAPQLAEALTGAAFVAGWLLVTWGVASFTAWQVWPISVGCLLISCAGWKLLLTMAREGLYTLTRARR